MPIINPSWTLPPLTDEMLAADTMMKSITEQIVAARMEWLERHLQHLVVEGTALSEIQIQMHPEGRTVIAVRDVPRFQWSIKYPDSR